MRTNCTYIKIFLSAILLAGINVNSEAQDALKKGKNLSLNISNTTKENGKTTYLNFGLLSNYNNLRGLSINIFSDVVHKQSEGLQITGLTNITGLNSCGMRLSGIGNITGINSKGVELTGLVNVSGKDSKGLQISGLGNVSGRKQTGMFISGIMNISMGTEGAQIAGLANVTGKELKGVAISGLANVSEGSKGLQIASLLNISAKWNKGVQLAAIGNVNITNNGMQMGGIANYSEENKGLQLGPVNVNSKSKNGIQIGIANISADSCARQIGMVNLKPDTRVEMIVSTGYINKLDLSIRLKNRLIYTQLGVGLIKGNITEKPSAAFSYRTGLSLPIIKKRLYINTDMGFTHIETIGNKYIPERLYSLTPRAGLEYRISNKIGIFVAGGYAWTRTYKGNISYSKSPVIDAGIAWKL